MMRGAGLLLGVVFSMGCGQPAVPTTVTVADHTDALTSGGTDQLFVLTLSQAVKAYPVADLTITVGLPGQTATVASFTHNDLDGDGQLDVGETLSCREPGVNLFDGSTVGKAVQVGFAERQSGTLFEVATVTWTPTN